MLNAAKAISDSLADKSVGEEDAEDDVQQLAAALIAKFTSATNVA